MILFGLYFSWCKLVWVQGFDLCTVQGPEEVDPYYALAQATGRALRHLKEGRGFPADYPCDIAYPVVEPAR